MKPFLLRPFFVFFLVFLVCATPAHADIMITPIYVIFDDRTRSADVTLLNTTDQTNVYRLEWSFTRQKEDGSYEKVETKREREIDPSSFMRFSPRQITLLPQTKQKVRIQLQKPADLPDGEYRAHLNFKRLPNDANIAPPEKGGRGLSMQLRVFLGISMPVVVRQGNYDAHAEFVETRFVERKNPTTEKSRRPELMVKVARSGKHGIYGRLRVFWNNGGQEEQIGALNNFSIYADNPHRVGYIPLTTHNIPSGHLRLVYEGDGPQRGQVIAEKSVNIGR